MTDLPLPLVPPGIDLRAFPNMQLDVGRLRDSELASVPDAEGFRVAVLSWCVAWHQVPAGSLPNDEPTLARMLGFGRDLRGWKRARAAGGLRGWILCSDGRLYHPVVAEKAVEAWAWKESSKRKRDMDAERLRRWREGRKDTRSGTDSETGFDTGVVAERTERNGTERNGTGENTPPPSPVVSPRDPTPAAATTALARRVRGADKTRIQGGIANGDPLLVAAGFGAHTGGERDDEWLRDTDGLQIGVVASIFAWMRWRKDPIREPSGFRKAKASWLDLTRGTRDSFVGLLEEFGVKLPETEAAP